MSRKRRRDRQIYFKLGDVLKKLESPKFANSSAAFNPMNIQDEPIGGFSCLAGHGQFPAKQRREKSCDNRTKRQREKATGRVMVVQKSTMVIRD